MPLNEKEYIQINQSLFSLTNAYSSRMEKESSNDAHNLLVSDRSVLMVLGQTGPIISKELSRLMGINPGTISVYVQRLVKKGLVTKTHDEIDRRNWFLHLTEAGEERYRETIQGAVIYTKDFLVVLSNEEQQVLHRLLLKASHGLGFTW